MSPAGGGGAGWGAAGALWRRFVLLWLSAAGTGTLLLFLFHCLFFSFRPEEGYGAAVYALRHLAEMLLPVVALSLLAFVLFAAGAASLICIRLLNRIAGPVFRLERELDRYLDGEPVRPFFARHRDLVPELAHAFNGFVAGLREDRKAWLGVLENADRLCLLDRDACRAEMEKALAGIQASLSRYR